MGTRFFSLLLPLLLSSSTPLACDWCHRRTRASFFSSSDSPFLARNSAAGSCGYGSRTSQLNGGHIAAGGPALFGVQSNACGGCYEVRCVHGGLCSKRGARVVLTDIMANASSHAGFVLSKEAFMAMAAEGMGLRLMRLETVDVKFRRIPCEYKNYNLSIRVEETSRKPHHLAIRFLYQGGRTDIAAVEVAQVGSLEWRYMTRDDKGPAWRTSRAPPGPLQFRLVVTAGYGGKWVWAEKEVLPMDWKAGEVYDTGVQINEVAHEACSPCEGRKKGRC